MLPWGARCISAWCRRWCGFGRILRRRSPVCRVVRPRRRPPLGRALGDIPGGLRRMTAPSARRGRQSRLVTHRLSYPRRRPRTVGTCRMSRVERSRGSVGTGGESRAAEDSPPMRSRRPVFAVCLPSLSQEWRSCLASGLGRAVAPLRPLPRPRPRAVARPSPANFAEVEWRGPRGSCPLLARS